MKKKYILACALAALGMVGCFKDDSSLGRMGEWFPQQ